MVCDGKQGAMKFRNETKNALNSVQTLYRKPQNHKTTMIFSESQINTSFPMQNDMIDIDAQHDVIYDLMLKKRQNH